MSCASIGSVSLVPVALPLGDANWRDFFREGYIFVAAIYFVSSFVMSRYSQWLEKRIGAGAKTR